MKRVILVLTILFFFFQAEAQQLIEGTIRELGRKKVFLLSFYGERTNKVDSVMADSSGHFTFNIRPVYLPGMYRVSWGKEGHVDLIWNREDVVFSTHVASPGDSLKILKSEENKVYQFYAAIDRINQDKLDLLIPVVELYPEKDDFYRLAAREMERIQKRQAGIADSLSLKHPGSYAVRVFRVYQTPFIPASLSRMERINYLRQHYFDGVDFTDTALLRSPAFANKAISYLALYGNNRLNQKQLEAEFIKAVTLMMSAAAVSPEVYKFLLDYLVGGFDKYHFDEVITYMAENFSDPFACEDQARKTALQKKLETFKKIAIGKVAPDLVVSDRDGKPVTLSKLTSEYLLLMFWSTECPHCVDMIPKVKTLYESQKPRRYEIVSVALDTSRTAWVDFSKESGISWINLSDLKGFDTKAADDYNIYATPTMFLLDREKKIIAKPISYRELEQVLKENGL